MSYTHKPGKGSLFKNDRQDKETSPQYKGSITDPEGNEYWLSAWINEGEKGKYFGLSMQLKEQHQRPHEKIQDAVKSAEEVDFDDTLPF